jgi:hypothetical protein
MRIRIQCNFADYKEGLLSQAGPPWRAYILVIAGTLLLLGGLWSATTAGFSDALPLLLPGAFAFLVPVLLRVFRQSCIERDFRLHPGFAKEGLMIVDDESLRIEEEFERRETKWPAFTKFQETDNLFMLFEGARNVRMFPKRAFSQQEQDEFRRLLSSKITSK